jgi:hypothetical protein
MANILEAWLPPLTKYPRMSPFVSDVAKLVMDLRNAAAAGESLLGEVLASPEFKQWEQDNYGQSYMSRGE